MRSFEWISLILTLALAGALGVGCGESTEIGNDAGDAVCGDGVVNDAADEACDDGNTDNDDGCDAQCTIEEGFVCEGEPSTCAKCGDGVVTTEAGETCDGGADLESAMWDGCAKPDSAPSKACRFVPAAFRFNSMKWISPHIEPPSDDPSCAPSIVTLLNGGINEATKTDSAGIASSIALPDCLVDLAFVIELDKLSQEDGDTIDGSFGIADCSITQPTLGCVAPTPSACSPTLRDSIGPAQDLTFRVSTDDDCLSVDEGHIPEGLEGATTAWPVNAGDYGCIVSDPAPLSVALGSAIAFDLEEGQVAARYNEPADKLQNGMLKGFLSEEAAAKVVVSAIIPLFGGTVFLDTLFPNSCGDADTGPGGAAGWWFYINFRAIEVPWEGGSLCGNGVVDEGEACDPAIASGEGSCVEITTCEDDGDECTAPTVVAGDPCNPITCHNIPITIADDGSDGCCPDTPQSPSVDEAVQKEDPNCPTYDPSLRPDLQ